MMRARCIPAFMPDDVATTLETYDRMARAIGGSSDTIDPRRDLARVESFLLRTGRPLPRVIVMGSELALRCRQVELAGGHPIGVDGAAAMTELARARYPECEYAVNDVRRLQLDAASYDGAWTGGVLSHLPKSEVRAGLAALHTALRPGGLLHACLPVGHGEGLEAGPHGEIYRAYWQAAEFEAACAELDFSLLLVEELPGDRCAMTLRREY